MNVELARQFCLKVIYGGELTPEESSAYEAFVQTAAGQRYMAESREMKDTLNSIARVELVTEDKSAMIERFENLLKQHAIESQKRFPLAVWLLLGPISLLLLISMLMVPMRAVFWDLPRAFSHYIGQLLCPPVLHEPRFAINGKPSTQRECDELLQLLTRRPNHIARRH